MPVAPCIVALRDVVLLHLLIQHRVYGHCVHPKHHQKETQTFVALLRAVVSVWGVNVHFPAPGC